MGTNFYFKREGEEIHIGKRSAAGLYCWDCDVSLCKEGASRVHYGNGDKDEWFEHCPVCGEHPTTEDLNNSSAGVELGFNKSKPGRKHGVASCSSFCWAMWPFDYAHIDPEQYKIFDEYDQEYTVDEFELIMQACPIQTYGSIGKDFS